MTSGNAFRSRDLVNKLASALAEAADGLSPFRIMHVCGTHEHEIVRFGIRQLFPDNVKLIAGPGCPVCITPAGMIATASALALSPERPVLCSYGDMVRVPAAGGSLLDKRGDGADVRIVYSIRDVLALAKEVRDRQVVFFSVGFETTAAPVAAVVLAGALPDNLTILACHRYVPTAVDVLAAQDDGLIGGYLLPGHASVITGTGPYISLSERYGVPSAIGGFEPAEILSAILSIVRQVRDKEPMVANCYRHVVRDEGNRAAQDAINEVFVRTDAAWRGLGVLPDTGLELRDEYAALDPLSRLGVEAVEAEDLVPGCRCHLVLTGRVVPEDCPLFRTQCTPENPRGACMVSTEGTCRSHYLFPETHDVR
jgi:hydrogenase expression/formation protein HypD